MTARWLALAAFASILSVAHAQDDGHAEGRVDDSAHATIDVAHTSGGRTEADVTPALSRLRAALRRCADAGRAASGAEVGVSLDVAANGRATAAAAGDSAAIAFQTCVLGALAHVRLEAGEAGTIELRIGWHEPRSYGVGTLGGLHARSSSLPDHPRPEHEVAPYPPEQVTQVARAHDSDVRSCFVAQTAHRPDISGTFRLRFTIGGDGTVSAVTLVTDHVQVAAITDCIMARVATWTFPPPGSGQPATVTQSFALR